MGQSERGEGEKRGMGGRERDGGRGGRGSGAEWRKMEKKRAKGRER